MTEQSADTPQPRRRGRPPGSTTGSGARTRRKRQGGSELVENLNSAIEQLIKENRRLKRQVEKLTASGTAAAGSTIERGLRTIQRRLQRAITDTTPTRRRRSTTGTGTATTRRRRTTATTGATRTRRRRTTTESE